MGDPKDFRNFMGAVIDKNVLHDNIARPTSRTPRGHSDAEREILAGGVCDDTTGLVRVQPTLIEAKDPGYRHHGARRSSARC